MTKPDFDDFSLGGGLTGVTNDLLVEYTKTIWYKVKLPCKDETTGKDYEICEMPMYPKFLERFGAERLSEISLMQVNEHFSPNTLYERLEESEKDRNIIDVARKIGNQMRAHGRLYTGQLSDHDLDIIKTCIPEYTDETIVKVKEYIRNIADADKMSAPTLMCGDGPRMDCTVSDYDSIESFPLTEEYVNKYNAEAKKVSDSYDVKEAVEKGPFIKQQQLLKAQRDALEREEFIKLFNKNADIPGNMLKKILAIPADNWETVMEKPCFLMRHHSGSREIRIELLFGNPEKFCTLHYCVTDGGGVTTFNAAYKTMDEMMTDGKNSATLLRLIAARYRSLTA